MGLDRSASDQWPVDRRRVPCRSFTGQAFSLTGPAPSLHCSWTTTAIRAADISTGPWPARGAAPRKRPCAPTESQSPHRKRQLKGKTSARAYPPGSAPTACRAPGGAAAPSSPPRASRSPWAAPDSASSNSAGSPPATAPPPRRHRTRPQPLRRTPTRRLRPPRPGAPPHPRPAPPVRRRPPPRRRRSAPGPRALWTPMRPTGRRAPPRPRPNPAPPRAPARRPHPPARPPPRPRRSRALRSRASASCGGVRRAGRCVVPVGSDRPDVRPEHPPQHVPERHPLLLRQSGQRLRAKSSDSRRARAIRRPSAVAAATFTRRSPGEGCRSTRSRASSRSTIPVTFDGSHFSRCATCRIGSGPRDSSPSTRACAPVSPCREAASSYSWW